MTSPVLDDTVVKNHTSDNLGHFPYHTMSANDGFLDARPLFHSSRLPNTRVCGDLGFGIDQWSLHQRSNLALSRLFQELRPGRQLHSTMASIFPYPAVDLQVTVQVVRPSCNSVPCFVNDQTHSCAWPMVGGYFVIVLGVLPVSYSIRLV